MSFYSNTFKNCKIIRYKYIQKIRPGVAINYAIIITLEINIKKSCSTRFH